VSQLDLPAGGLTGRVRELDFLQGFFGQAAVSGGALLLTGDPGVGKTALLNALADAAAAAGTTVLRVAGVEFEGDVSFSGLNLALLPLLGDLDGLGAAHRDALRVALGFGAGPAPDRLLVSNAALALLRHVAARVPLLLIVDDLPWIDRASADVLGFAARRLVGSRAGLLVACRTGAQSYFDRAGLPEYELTPLADEAAAQLVTARFPGLDPLVRSRVLDVAQGNPLALLELPRALSDSQRSAAEPLPPVLPLGQRLQELFTSRFARLPAATRELLLTAALEGTGDLRVLQAAGGGDYQLDDLAPAERDQLVRADGNPRRVTFRHPLIRSAAVEVSTAGQRRRAHRALAAVLADQPERRALHLGEACVEPDEEVAGLLDEAARRTLARGDYSGAVAMLTRAAELSPAAAERSRRLAGAAALPRLEAALRTVHHEADPNVIENIAGSAMYADRLAEVREPLWRSVLRGREGGLGRRHLVALMDLCTDDFHRGEWGEAAELAAEGLRVSEERGGRFFGWYFRYHQALLAAVQGRFDTSRALASQIIGWAGPRGVRTAQVFAHQPLVLADLGQGDFESAYSRAAAMSPAGTLASHVPHCLWVVMDLVEAAVRTRRQAEAERHVRAMAEADIAALSPRLAILAAASAAIAAGDGQAPALFEQALSLPTVDQWPFDVARVRLAYGERLRRARAAAESRIQLETALAAFQKLGAAPWAARAELELRATGRTRTSSATAGTVALTPQELQIARLAASGLTNKEIAERLFLSPRTVSGHLYQVFPKLGITKRAALRDALDAMGGSLGPRVLRRCLQVGGPAVERALRGTGVRFAQREGGGAAGREAGQDRCPAPAGRDHPRVVGGDVDALAGPRQPAADGELGDPRAQAEAADLVAENAVRLQASASGIRDASHPDAGERALPEGDGGQLPEHDRGRGIDDRLAAGPDVRALGRITGGPAQHLARVGWAGHGRVAVGLRRARRRGRRRPAGPWRWPG
jgi:DNA-binding CsgD family transcriptional regulator